MLIRLRNAEVACLLIAWAFAAGCHAKRTAEVRQPSPLTPVAQEIQRRGYRAKDSWVVEPTPWEISTFRMRSKRFFSFRADQQMPNERENYYVRFSLFEETYDSLDDARYRLLNLHRASPDTDSDNEYVRSMRTGFSVGSVVYVFQTDAVIFWGEVKRLANQLANSTPGAELER
jgi:hypothetical protein